MPERLLHDDPVPYFFWLDARMVKAGRPVLTEAD